jgi:hypothetical protein
MISVTYGLATAALAGLAVGGGQLVTADTADTASAP